MTDRLTGFDLDDDFDLDLDLADDGGGAIPKSRVATIVQKRLAKERSKAEKAQNEFRK